MLSQMVYHPAMDSGSLWPTEGIQLLLTIPLTHDGKLEIIHLQPSESSAARGQKDKDRAEDYCPCLARHSLCLIVSLPDKRIYTEELHFSSSLGILTSATQIRPWSSLMFYILSAEVGKRICFSNIHPYSEVTGYKIIYYFIFFILPLFFLYSSAWEWNGTECNRMEWNRIE